MYIYLEIKIMNKIFTLFLLFLSLSFIAHTQQNTTESQQIQTSNSVVDNLTSAQTLNLVHLDFSPIQLSISLIYL